MHTRCDWSDCWALIGQTFTAEPMNVEVSISLSRLSERTIIESSKSKLEFIMRIKPSTDGSTDGTTDGHPIFNTLIFTLAP